jgi:hypothetical protein
MYALEGPDEPDLGLNISYLTACRAIGRLAVADPWDVPRQTARAIRGALARIEDLRDPRELEAELLSFPAWVLRALDRRGTLGGRAADPVRRRRLSDQRVSVL